jgi:hypothetical protein
MKSFIEKIIPSDPPLMPMNLSREPIVNRFWATGIFGLVLGFVLGFLLWLWQQGIMEFPDDYFALKVSHAKIQILLFAGSFLLGFALQAGPHVIGGPPPPSRKILSFLPLLWVGIGLSLVPDPALNIVGNLLISIAFAGPAYLLLGITISGMAHFRIPRGIPIASAFALLSVAPWLELDNPDVALFVIWCGPVTAALVAAQQLTNNVLGGSLLQGKEAKLFAIALIMAWVTTAMAAFHEYGSWQISGAFWLLVLFIQIKGTNFLPAALRYNFSAIQVTLLLAFAGLAASALMPLMALDDFMPDAAVHLLGAGVITVLILGVAARVAGFFCGNMVMRDRGLVYLLLAWSILAIVRTLTPMGWSNPTWTMGTMHLGVFLLIIWVIPMSDRLIKIGQQFTPDTNSKNNILFNKVKDK